MILHLQFYTMCLNLNKITFNHKGCHFSSQYSRLSGNIVSVWLNPVFLAHLFLLHHASPAPLHTSQFPFPQASNDHPAHLKTDIVHQWLSIPECTSKSIILDIHAHQFCAAFHNREERRLSPQVLHSSLLDPGWMKKHL